MFRLIALLLIAGPAALATTHAAEATDRAYLHGLTYEGSFEIVTRDTKGGFEGAGDGTIAITLAADRSSVTHIKTEGYVAARTVDGELLTQDLGQNDFFAPGLPVIDGRLTVSVGVISGPQVHIKLDLDIHVDSKERLSGTGQVLDFPATPFVATGPGKDTPPLASVLTAQVEGHSGSLLIELDANGGVQAYTLIDMSLPPCLDEPQTLTVTFDSPVPLEETSIAWLYLAGVGPHRMWLTGARTEGLYKGSLHIFPGDCSTRLGWEEIPSPPLPTATESRDLTATPGLPAPPSTGGYGSTRHGTWWYAAVALAAIGLFSLRLTMRGR